MNNDEAALVEAARRGDDGALARLLSLEQGRILRFGLRMCRDEEDAKDVVQDTMLAVARGIADFRGESSLSTWLFTIARSACIKKRKKLPPAGSSLDDPAHAPRIVSPLRPPDEAAAGRALERALDDAIAALEPAAREVLLLRDVEGLSAAEVADVLGISVTAVKSRLHRARLGVRQRLAPLLDVPAPEAACPDVLARFSRYLEGDVGAADCADMERHLVGCARCRGACDSLKRTLALCKAMPPGEVPQDVQDAVRKALRAL